MSAAVPPEGRIRREELHFGADDGADLFRRTWTPADPRVALLVVHGYAEHCGRYEHLGAWFAARGVAVHAYDQRGHGRSSGPRGHVDRFSRFHDDLQLALDGVRTAHPDLPLFLLGHSMGGLVVASFAIERAPQLDGLVLSGAALELAAAPAWMTLIGRVLRRIAPRMAIPSSIDANGISTDPKVVEAYVADPLVHTRMSASFAVEFLDAARRTAPEGARVELPMLVLHGADDPLCAASGSEVFARAAADAVHRCYPGMKHEIFNEPDHESVFADVLAWLRERVPDALPKELASS